MNAGAAIDWAVSMLDGRITSHGGQGVRIGLVSLHEAMRRGIEAADAWEWHLVGRIDDPIIDVDSGPDGLKTGEADRVAEAVSSILDEWEWREIVAGELARLMSPLLGWSQYLDGDRLYTIQRGEKSLICLGADYERTGLNVFRDESAIAVVDTGNRLHFEVVIEELIATAGGPWGLHLFTGYFPEFENARPDRVSRASVVRGLARRHRVEPWVDFEYGTPFPDQGAAMGVIEQAVDAALHAEGLDNPERYHELPIAREPRPTLDKWAAMSRAHKEGRLRWGGGGSSDH